MSFIDDNRKAALLQWNDFRTNRAVQSSRISLAYELSAPYGVSRHDDDLLLIHLDPYYIKEDLSTGGDLSTDDEQNEDQDESSVAAKKEESHNGLDMMRTLTKKITETIFSANSKEIADLTREKEVLDMIDQYKQCTTNEDAIKNNLLNILKKYKYIDQDQKLSNEDLVKLSQEISQGPGFTMGTSPRDLMSAVYDYIDNQKTIGQLDNYFKTDGRQFPVVQDLMYKSPDSLRDDFKVGAASAFSSLRNDVSFLERFNDDNLLNTVGAVFDAPLSLVSNTLFGQNKNVAISAVQNGDPIIDALYFGRKAFDKAGISDRIKELRDENQRLYNKSNIKAQADAEFYTTGVIHPSLVLKTMVDKADLFDIANKYTELNQLDLGNGKDRKDDLNSYKIYNPEDISKTYELELQQYGWKNFYRLDLGIPEIGSTLGLAQGLIGSSAANSVANWAARRWLTGLNQYGRRFALLKSAITAVDVSAGVQFAKLSRIDETAGEAMNGQAERVLDILAKTKAPVYETISDIRAGLLKFGYSNEQLDMLSTDKLVLLGIAYNIRTRDGIFNDAVRESRKGLNELINANNSLAYMDYLGCYLPFTSYGGSVLNSLANKAARTGERMMLAGPIRILTKTPAATADKIAIDQMAGSRLYNPNSVTKFTPTIGGILDDVAVPVVQRFKPEVDAVFDHLATRASSRFAKNQLPKLALWTKHIGDYVGNKASTLLGVGVTEGLEEGNQEILQLRYKKGLYDDINTPYTIFSIPDMLEDVDLTYQTTCALFGLDNEFTGQERDQIRRATSVGFMASVLLPFIGNMASNAVKSDQNNIRNLFAQLKTDAQVGKVLSKDQQVALDKIFMDNQVIRSAHGQELQDIQDWKHASVFFDALHKKGVTRERQQKAMLDYIDILDQVNTGKIQDDETLISKQFIKSDIDLLNAVATLYDSPFIKEIVKDNKWAMYGEEHKQAVIDGATQIIGAAIHNKVADEQLTKYHDTNHSRRMLLDEYFDEYTPEERKQQILELSPFMSAFINHAVGLFDKSLAPDVLFGTFRSNPNVQRKAQSILESRLLNPETSINPERANEDDVTKQQWTLEDVLKEEYEKHKNNPAEYKRLLSLDKSSLKDYAEKTLQSLQSYRELIVLLKVLTMLQNQDRWQKELNSLTGLDTSVKDLHGAITDLKHRLENLKNLENKTLAAVNKDLAEDDKVTFEKIFKDTPEFDDAQEVEKLLTGFFLNSSTNSTQATVRNAYLTGVTVYGKAVQSPQAVSLNDALYGDDENSPIKSISDSAAELQRQLSEKDELERTIEDLEELSHVDEKAAKAMIAARVKEKQRRNKIAHRIYEQERPLTADDIDAAEEGDSQASQKVIDTLQEGQPELELSIFGNGGMFREDHTDAEARHNEDGTTAQDDALLAMIESAAAASQKSEETTAEEHHDEQEDLPSSTDAQPGPAPVLGTLAAMAADDVANPIVEILNEEEAPIVEGQQETEILPEGESETRDEETSEEQIVPENTEGAVEPSLKPEENTSEQSKRNQRNVEESERATRQQLVTLPEELADIDVTSIIENARSNRSSRTREQNERRATRKANSNNFGEKNKVVTRQLKDKAVDYIKKTLSGKSGGLRYIDSRNAFALPIPIPTDLVAAMSDLAVFVIEAGSRKFGEFVHEMYDQLRDNGVSHEDILSMQGIPEINFKSLYTKASTRYVYGGQPELNVDQEQTAEELRNKEREEEERKQREEERRMYLEEQEERRRQEEEAKKKQQDEENAVNAELSMLDAISKMDMDETTGTLILNGDAVSAEQLSKIMGELEFLLSSEYNYMLNLIEQTNSKGNTDPRFAQTKRLIANYIARTFFYDPNADTTMDLSIDGKAVTLNKPLAPGSQLAKKLLDHNWLKNATKYYAVTRREDVAKDSVSRNNPDCFNVVMIIEDESNSYAVALRQLGSYMATDENGRTYVTNNEILRRKWLEKLGTRFEDMSVSEASKALFEMELSIAETIYEAQGNPRPIIRVDSVTEQQTPKSLAETIAWKKKAHEWYTNGPKSKVLEKSWKNAVAEIKERARKKAAKDGHDVLTNEQIDEHIESLRKNRNEIIDAVLSKTPEGEYIFPDASKPYPQTVHPKNYNQSNGLFDNMVDENENHVFRPIHEGNIQEVQKSIDEGNLIIGLGLGFFSKTSPGQFVIRTMGEDSREIDGKGYSGKLYTQIDTPNGGSAVIMLSEEKFDTQERADGSAIQANTNAQIVLDTTGNITETRYKVSAAEALLHLMCGMVPASDPIFEGNDELAKMFATFFVNNGEATILQGISSKSKLFKSKIAQFASKLMYWDEENEDFYIALPYVDENGLTQYNLKRFSKADLFSGTNNANENKLSVMKAIASQMHWNTEENHIVAKFSDGQFAEMMDALRRYFIQTGEQSVSILGCPQLTFNKDDLFDSEMNIRKGVTVLSWMIKTMRIKTDVSKNIFKNPWVFADGVEHSATDAVIKEAEGANSKIEEPAPVESSVSVVNAQSEKLDSIRKMREFSKLDITEESSRDAILGQYEAMGISAGRKVKDVLVMDISEIRGSADDVWKAIQDKINTRFGKDKVLFEDNPLMVKQLVSPLNTRRGDTRQVAPLIIVYQDGSAFVSIVRANNIINSGVTGVFSKEKRGKLNEKKARKWLKNVLGLDDLNVIVSNAILKSVDGQEVYGLTCLSLDVINDTLAGDIHLSRQFGSDLQYHEAWHYVNLLLHNAKERTIIYNEYVKLHPELKNKPLAEVEETIANEFMAYMTMRDSILNPVKLIKRLFDNVKTLLNIGNNKGAYRMIFEAVRKGRYASMKMDQQSVKEFQKRFPMGIAYDGYIQNVDEEVLRKMKNIKSYHDFYNTADAIIHKIILDFNIRSIRDIRAKCGVEFEGVLKNVKSLADKLSNPTARAMIMDFVDNPKAFLKALVSYFSKFGIKAKVKSFKDNKQDDLKSPLEPAIDGQDELDEKPEEERGLEYDVFDLAKPKKNNAAIETKLFMSMIPVLERVIKEDGSIDYIPAVDDFGLPKYYTFGESWTSLLEVLHNCDSFDKRGKDGLYLPNSVMGLCERRAKSTKMFRSVLNEFNSVLNQEKKGFYIQLKQMLQTTFNSSKPKVLYIQLKDPQNIDIDNQLDMLVSAISEYGSADSSEEAYRTVSDKDRVWELFNDSRFDIIRAVPRRWSLNAVLNGLTTIDKSGNMVVDHTFVYNILTQLGYDVDANTLTEREFLSGKGKLSSIKMREADNSVYENNGLLTNIEILNKLLKKKNNRDAAQLENIDYIVSVITDLIIDLLNSMGIMMDNEVLDAYVMMSEKTTYKNLNNDVRSKAYAQLMRKSSDKSGGNIMGIVTLLVQSVNQTTLNTGQKEGKPVEELFNRFKPSTDIAKLALANNAAHPSKQEFSVRGANGDMLYPISLNNFISDVVRWLNNGEGLSNELGLSDEESSYARRLSKSSYAAHSMVLNTAKQLDDKTLEDDKIKLFAFVGMKDLNNGSGADYLGITPMEDYLSKMFMLESDHLTKQDRKNLKNGESVVKLGQIVLPIMSDKKTYYSIGSTSMRLCHDVVLFKPNESSRLLALNERYTESMSAEDAARFDSLTSLEQHDVTESWYDQLTEAEQMQIDARANLIQSSVHAINRFSHSTLDRFANYFVDELQSLIDYYNEDNVKSLVKNPLQLIENFHGKVKGGRLQFGGNGGLFRYFYDVQKYTDKNGYQYNLNQRLEYLWNLQKQIESGKLKIDEVDADEDIKNVTKLVLGKSRNLDGFELIRAELQKIKNDYFLSNRNVKYAAKPELYDSINEMLISSVNKEMIEISTDPSLELVSYINGMIIPEKLPKQFIDMYVDDILLEDPNVYRRDAVENATYSLIANNVVNNLISIIEYEKIFCGDPALYKAKGLKSVIDHEGMERKSRVISDSYSLPDGRIASFECEVLTLWDKFSDKIKRHGGQLSPGEEITLFYNQLEIEYDLLCKRPSYLNTTKYTNLHVEDLMGTSMFLGEIRTNFLRQTVVDLVRDGNLDAVKAFDKYLENRNKKQDRKISKDNLINLFYSKSEVFQDFYKTLSGEIKSVAEKMVDQQIRPYTDITVADAQVIVRPSMYRKIRIGLGQWSFEPDPTDPSGYCDEDAYNDLMNNAEWMSDEEKGRLVRKLELFPLKMSYFQNDPSQAGTQNINLAIYGKQAIFPLFEFNARTEAAKRVYNRMNQQGNELDMISFKSAIKVGGTKNALSFIEEDDLARYVYIQKNAYGKDSKQIRDDYKKLLMKKDGLSELKAESEASKKLSNKNQQALLDKYSQQIQNQLSALSESLENDSDVYILYTDVEGNPLDVPVVKNNTGDDLLHVTLQDLKFLRMQLNTRAHAHEERSIGSQMFKIAFSNIIDNEQYGIGKPGQLRSGTQLKDDVMACVNALTRIGAEEIKSKYYSTIGDRRVPNKNAIRKWIQRVIENNGLGSSAAEVIANGGVISSLMSRTLFEQTVSKAVGDSVVKINTNGGTAVQQSSFGFGNIAPNINRKENVETLGDNEYGSINNGNELKWSMEDGSMEVILSANFFNPIVPKEFKDTHEHMRQWLIDNDYINGIKSNGKKSHPKQIGVGYRIPTQGMSSMFVFTCADILPETSGDTIIVPKEFTAQTGSDFDVDKLYLALLACENGEVVTMLDIDEFEWAYSPQVWKQVFDSLKSRDERIQIFGSDKWNEVSVDNKNEDVIEYIKLNHADIVKSVKKSIVGDAKSIHQLSKRLKEEFYSMQNEKAVQNQLIKDYMTIISDVKNYAMARASIDTLTNMIKDNLLPYVQDKHTDYIPSFTELLPSFQSRKKMEFSTGKDGIAPFALSITNLALTLYAHLSMNYGSNLYNLGDLDKIDGSDGLRIADWLSAMVNAHVDVAKDPYVFAINVNKMTYNHTSFLLRAGKGLSTFTFLAQPALKEFAARAAQRNALYGGNMDGKKSAGDPESVTKHKVMKAEMKSMFDKLNVYYNIVKESLSEEDKAVYKNLYDHFSYETANVKLKGSKKTPINEDIIRKIDVFNIDAGLDAIKHYNRQSNSAEDALATYNSIVFQLLSLHAYNELSGYADNLAELVHNSQIDTQKFGNTIMEHVNFQNSMTVFINKSDGWKITNNDKLDSKDALLLYFNQLYLMDKFITSTTMVKEILRDWTFTANPGVIKLFKGICETLFGSEEISVLDKDGKPTGEKRSIGYKTQKDTELIDLIASCIDNAVRHSVLFNAATLVRDKSGNPLSLEDKYGPIDFTMGGGANGVVLTMAKLHGLIYGNPTEHGGRNVFQRLANMITYLQTHPYSEAAEGLVENGKIINELLLQLHPQQASEKNPVGKISLLQSLMNMDDDQKAVLASAFYELLNSPTDLIRDLARDLVFYSYYTDYNQNSRDTIFDLIPYEYRQLYDMAIALGLKNREFIIDLDSDTVEQLGGFNSAIRQGIGSGTSVIDKYIAIISRNYWYNDKIVPRYFDTKGDKSQLSSEHGTIYANLFRPDGATSRFPGLIMSTNLQTFDRRNNPPYFKIKKGSHTVLYQNIGSVTVPYETKKETGRREWRIWVPVLKAGVHEGGLNYKEMYCDFECPSIYENNKLPEAWARTNLINTVKQLVDQYNLLKTTTIPVNFDPNIDIQLQPQMYDLVADRFGDLNRFMYYETDSQQSLDRDVVHIVAVKTNSTRITDDVVKQSKIVIEIGSTQASSSAIALKKENVIHIDSSKDLQSILPEVYRMLDASNSTMSSQDRKLAGNTIPTNWSTVLSQSINVGVVGDSQESDLSDNVSMFIQTLVNSGVRIDIINSASSGKNHTMADAVAAASVYTDIKSKIFVPKNLLRQMLNTSALPEDLGDILMEAEKAIQSVQSDQERGKFISTKKQILDKYNEIFNAINEAKRQLRNSADFSGNTGSTLEDKQKIENEIKQAAAEETPMGGLASMFVDEEIDLAGEGLTEKPEQNQSGESNSDLSSVGSLAGLSSDDFGGIDPLNEC